MTIADHHSTSESFLKHMQNEVSDQALKHFTQCDCVISA